METACFAWAIKRPSAWLKLLGAITRRGGHTWVVLSATTLNKHPISRLSSINTMQFTLLKAATVLAIAFGLVEASAIEKVRSHWFKLRAVQLQVLQGPGTDTFKNLTETNWSFREILPRRRTLHYSLLWYIYGLSTMERNNYEHFPPDNNDLHSLPVRNITILFLSTDVHYDNRTAMTIAETIATVMPFPVAKFVVSSFSTTSLTVARCARSRANEY